MNESPPHFAISFLSTVTFGIRRAEAMVAVAAANVTFGSLIKASQTSVTIRNDLTSRFCR